MEILHYKIVKYTHEFEAICIEHPHITWIADTPQEALAGVEEEAFQYFLEKGMLDGIMTIISLNY